MYSIQQVNTMTKSFDKDVVEASFNKYRGGFQSAVDDLNAAFMEERHQMYEQVFQAKLLPLVRKWCVENDSTDLRLWVHVAKGINNEIDVLDGNGKLLFVVPPPFTPVSVPTTRLGDVTQIHGLSQLITMKERDGDSRIAMELSSQLASMIGMEADRPNQIRHTIMLAKIWDHYKLPMSEILGTLDIDLELFDINGYLIATEDGPVIQQGTEHDDEEDEFIF